MSAFVEHDFEKGFLLDEIRLRKLHELVEARLSKLAAPLRVTFKVYRGDSYAYETTSVEEVAREDNEDWKAISKLELTAETKDRFEFRLSFSGKRPKLMIVGDDRDAVFLLFSDVREYMTNEVLASRAVSSATSRSIWMAISMLAMVGLFWSTFSHLAPNEARASAALASDDMAAKLNFVIEDRLDKAPRLSMMLWTVAAFLPLLMSWTGVIEGVWQVFFPTNLFLFGKKKAKFDSRKKLLSNIFWVVIVGIVVSVVAGVLESWFTGT